ncbi:hypothetical protein Ddc_23997 [Ditylenchus destructor]|nr:hypothetical protein Ddc_23997 [Ditylenchus destructor]
MLRGDEDLAADLEQNPCQQGGRQRCRDALDQFFKAAGHPANRHQHGAGDIGTDGLAITHPPGCDRPMLHTAMPMEIAQIHDEICAVVKPAACPLEHQDQGAGVAGHHGDEASDNGRRRRVGQRGAKALGWRRS